MLRSATECHQPISENRDSIRLFWELTVRIGTNLYLVYRSANVPWFFFLNPVDAVYYVFLDSQLDEENKVLLFLRLTPGLPVVYFP